MGPGRRSVARTTNQRLTLVSLRLVGCQTLNGKRSSGKFGTLQPPEFELAVSRSHDRDADADRPSKTPTSTSMWQGCAADLRRSDSMIRCPRPCRILITNIDMIDSKSNRAFFVSVPQPNCRTRAEKVKSGSRVEREPSADSDPSGKKMQNRPDSSLARMVTVMSSVANNQSRPEVDARAASESMRVSCDTS